MMKNKFNGFLVFIIFIILILNSIVLGEENCVVDNDCENMVGKPYCLLVTSGNKKRCRKCKTNCDCQPNYYCATDVNYFQETEVGTCKPITYSATSRLGKQCINIPNINEVIKSENSKQFCGLVSEWREQQSTYKATKFAWIGKCVYGKCQICNSGENDGCGRTCINNRFQEHTDESIHKNLLGLGTVISSASIITLVLLLFCLQFNFVFILSSILHCFLLTMIIKSIKSKFKPSSSSKDKKKSKKENKKSKKSKKVNEKSSLLNHQNENENENENEKEINNNEDKDKDNFEENFINNYQSSSSNAPIMISSNNEDDHNNSDDDDEEEDDDDLKEEEEEEEENNEE